MNIIDNHAVPDRHEYKYALIFIDIAMRLLFVYGLKRKSDAFTALGTWRDHVSLSDIVCAIPFSRCIA